MIFGMFKAVEMSSSLDFAQGLKHYLSLVKAFRRYFIETVNANIESKLGGEEEVFFYVNALDDSDNELSDKEDDQKN